MFETFQQDLARYGPGSRHPMRTALLHPGAWATGAYRFSVWATAPERSPGLRSLWRGLATLVQAGARASTHVDLATEARIGPGLYLPHAGFVIVGPGSCLGAHCTLAPGSVLGHAAGGTSDATNAEHESVAGGEPTLGDRVYVGPGAKLVGPVTIGDDALIGIGAVVTRSVPARGVVAGNPARLLHEGGAFALVRYPGMETDPERGASLSKRSTAPRAH